jgi:cell surface protein SprA
MNRMGPSIQKRRRILFGVTSEREVVIRITIKRFNVGYTLPINKIPLFDFITANVSYNTGYAWTASPQVRDSATNGFKANPLGNLITNNQADKAKVDFNFKKDL